MGKLYRLYQSHQGAVNTSTSPRTQFAYDGTQSGGVYMQRLRKLDAFYPVDEAQLRFINSSAGSADDRLRRVRYQKVQDATLNGALQTLNNFLPTLGSGAFPDEWRQALLAAIATHVVGNRSDRYEPRRLKKRPKPYPLLREPRANY